MRMGRHSRHVGRPLWSIDRGSLDDRDGRGAADFSSPSEGLLPRSHFPKADRQKSTRPRRRSSSAELPQSGPSEGPRRVENGRRDDVCFLASSSKGGPAEIHATRSYGSVSVYVRKQAFGPSVEGRMRLRQRGTKRRFSFNGGETLRAGRHFRREIHGRLPCQGSGAGRDRVRLRRSLRSLDDARGRDS